MKKTKLLFTCMLLLVWMGALAQTSELGYRPFAENSKIWETQIGGIKENVYGNCIDGDTLINGESWKKVYNYVGCPDFNFTYYAAIRDVGKKVYVIAKGSTRPRLLYNFDLKVNSMLKCGVEGNALGCLLDADEKPDTLLGFPFVTYLKVERIDTIKVRDLEYRRFTLSLLDAFQEYFRSGEDEIIGSVIWIEGVGSGAGPFSPWMSLPPRNMLLLNCETNRTHIFGHPDFYETDNANAINHPQPTMRNNIIYDLEGRLLLETPTQGIYIKNGKKKATK